MRRLEGTRLKEEVDEMSPPEPVKCHGYGLGDPPCQYVSRQGLPTHQLISDDLQLHARVCSAMNRPTTTSSRPGPRPQRLDRPEIGEEASEEDWRSLNLDAV